VYAEVSVRVWFVVVRNFTETSNTPGEATGGETTEMLEPLDCASTIASPNHT
jgi:hypothetical protein